VVKSSVLRFSTTYGGGREAIGHLALHARAVGDATATRDVDRHARSILGLRAEAADDEAALGNGVDLSIDTRSGVMIRLPPRRLPALPIEDRHVDGLAALEKAGRSACTVTAATFFNEDLRYPEWSRRILRACS